MFSFVVDTKITVVRCCCAHWLGYFAKIIEFMSSYLVGDSFDYLVLILHLSNT